MNRVRARRYGATAIVVAILTVAAVVATGSGGGGGGARTKTKPAPTSGEAPVYVTLGGRDVSGNDFGFSFVDVWPQILFRTSFPRDTTHINLGRDNAASAEILLHQVDRAVSVNPDVVAITLFQDATLGTSPDDVERTLGEILDRFGRNGATRVFVGTIPLDVASPDLVVSLNVAIGRVVGVKGATLVELSEVDETDRDARSLQIADAFAAALTDATT